MGGGNHRRKSERISKRRPGPNRQRRRRANPARHLWQHHPCRHAHVLRPEIAAGKGTKDFSTCWRRLALRRRRSPSPPMPAYGNFVAGPTFTLIPRQCAGPDAAGWRRSRRTSVSPIGPLIGREVSDGIQRRLLEEAWSDKRGAFTAALGDNDLDASVLLLPSSA